jgi:carboxyl-terminal processing protease
MPQMQLMRAPERRIPLGTLVNAFALLALVCAGACARQNARDVARPIDDVGGIGAESESKGAGSGAPRVFEADERRRCLESFDMVWNTVKTTHYDSTLGGLDWQRVYDELRPRMDSAKTSGEARSIIEAMLAPLNQSHFLILSEEYYQGERTDTALANFGVCGFDIRLIGGSVVVTSVMKDSPAYAMGVRPGWEVVRINNVPVTKTMDELAGPYRGKTRFEFELIHTLYNSLSGEIGDSGPVLFRDEENRERKLEIVLVKPPGRYVPAYGNLSPAFVDFEARETVGGVGYIRFNGFAGAVILMSSFSGAMDSLRSGKGLILDLRGNSGGIGSIALAMADWFVREKGKSLATIASRDRRDWIIVTPRAVTYGGPLAVLIDGLTASAAEFLAGGLQDLGRARLFGTRTAGFSQRGDILRLPDGDIFMHATAQHLRANGDDVEGRGIEPDVEVRSTRKSLLEGRDAALEAALEWFSNEKK